MVGTIAMAITNRSKTKPLEIRDSIQPFSIPMFGAQAPTVLFKMTYPNKDFNERLKNLSVNDQLDLVWISGSDVGNGPSGLFNNV